MAPRACSGYFIEYENQIYVDVRAGRYHARLAHCPLDRNRRFEFRISQDIALLGELSRKFSADLPSYYTRPESLTQLEAAVANMGTARLYSIMLDRTAGSSPRVRRRIFPPIAPRSLSRPCNSSPHRRVAAI